MSVYRGFSTIEKMMLLYRYSIIQYFKVECWNYCSYIIDGLYQLHICTSIQTSYLSSGGGNLDVVEQLQSIEKFLQNLYYKQDTHLETICGESIPHFLDVILYIVLISTCLMNWKLGIKYSLVHQRLLLIQFCSLVFQLFLCFITFLLSIPSYLFIT